MDNILVTRPPTGAQQLHLIWAFVPGEPPQMLYARRDLDSARATVAALNYQANLANIAVTYEIISTGF